MTGVRVEHHRGAATPAAAGESRAPHRAAEEAAVGPGDGPGVGLDRDHRTGGVLVGAEVMVGVLGLSGGQSLGVGPASYGQACVKLAPGTIVALYTDGLVETRTRPFDQGIRALRSALTRQHQHLDATCEHLITSLAEHREDDVTIVLARIPLGPAAASA